MIINQRLAIMVLLLHALFMFIDKIINAYVASRSKLAPALAPILLPTISQREIERSTEDHISVIVEALNRYVNYALLPFAGLICFIHNPTQLNTIKA